MKSRHATVLAVLAALLAVSPGCSRDDDAAQRQNDADLIAYQRGRLETLKQDLEEANATLATTKADLAMLKSALDEMTRASSTSQNASSSPEPANGEPKEEPEVKPKHPPFFTLTSGNVEGQSRFDAMWVFEHSTSRLVTVMFNGANDKLEVIAGRDLAQDVKAQLPRGRDGREPPEPPIAPPNVKAGATTAMVRCSPDVDCFVTIDNANARLLIYKVDLARKRIELVATEDLAKLFNLK